MTSVLREEGLFGKYLIRKSDGTLLAPEAKYFVVRYDAAAEHGHVGRSALAYYCHQLGDDCPKLKADLMAEISDETDKAISLIKEGAT